MNTTASGPGTAAGARKLVTKAAYARHRGCARSYITKLAKAGRLPMVDGKIDVGAADAALGPPQSRVATVTQDSDGGAQRPEQPLALTPQGQAPDYAVSRAWREFYAAEKAKRDLAELDGALLRYTDVVQSWSTRIAAARNKIRGIPKRAPREIRGFTKAMARPLLKMIDEVLRDLAGDGVPRAGSSRRSATISPSTVGDDQGRRSGSPT